MNIFERLRKVKIFFDEVRTEVTKTAWPERRELAESTIVVIVSVVLLSVFIGLCDQLLAVLIGLLVS